MPPRTTAQSPVLLRPLAMLRWLPMELRAGPSLLLALLAVASLWGLIWSLSNYGLVTNDGIGASAPYEIACLSGTVGASLACYLLSRRPWLLEQLAERERKLALFLVLFVVSGLFQVAGTALPALFSPGVGSGWVAGGLLSSLHWAALGLLTFALPLTAIARPGVLLTLGWWLPALLASATDDGWVSRLRWILDPSRYLVLPNGPAATSGASLVDMAPAAALLLLAAALPFPARHER